jgi:hypothetical protein
VRGHRSKPDMAVPSSRCTEVPRLSCWPFDGRLCEACGRISPASLEAAYYRQNAALTEAGQTPTCRAKPCTAVRMGAATANLREVRPVGRGRLRAGRRHPRQHPPRRAEAVSAGDDRRPRRWDQGTNCAHRRLPRISRDVGRSVARLQAPRHALPRSSQSRPTGRNSARPSRRSPTTLSSCSPSTTTPPNTGPAFGPRARSRPPSRPSGTAPRSPAAPAPAPPSQRLRRRHSAAVPCSRRASTLLGSRRLAG